MPAGAGVHTLWRVSELPDAEQAEVRSAMALFHAFAEHQAGAGQGTPNSVQEQARADSATFMRQWQTEAIILGWQGAAETYAAGAIPDEVKAAPYGLSVAIIAHLLSIRLKNIKYSNVNIFCYHRNSSNQSYCKLNSEHSL